MFVEQERSRRRAASDRRGDHRPPPAAAACAGRARAQLHRRRPHGAALPAHDDGSGLRRGRATTATSSRRSDVEWEELSFSVNGTKWGPDRPAFPLLQAEKVLSLPLQLRFDNDYRYRLAGTERVGEYDCYVVRFDPVGTRPIAVPGDGLDRSAHLRTRQGTGGPDHRCRRRSCPTKRSRPTRRSRRSATGRCSCSPASPRGRSCSSPGATCSSRRAWCSPTST